MRRLRPPQLVLLSFGLTIVLGAVGLALPAATESGTPLHWIDALFTSTSAVCVTGLVVVPTGPTFSPIGEWLILLLIQVGGLGIMTLATFFAILFGRKLTLADNVVIQRALNSNKVEGLPKLIVYILLLTLLAEAGGAILLHWRWGNWYQAVFHAVSAFCNAGIGLWPTSIQAFRGDWVVNLVFMGLIVTGGLGFIVALDVLRFLRRRWTTSYHLSLQTRIVLWVTAGLLVIGAALVWVLESHHALSGLRWQEQALAASFLSVTPRTAGFTTVPTATLTPGTLWVLIALMFIGASPGSTGGGIKTATFAVLVASWWAMFRNRDRIALFKRTVPKDVTRKAWIVASMSLLWVWVMTLTLSLTEPWLMSQPHGMLGALFEVVSAFGTVGLSTGVTPYLSGVGKLLLVLTMFIGRVGPLTLALSVAAREATGQYRYAEEPVMVG